MSRTIFDGATKVHVVGLPRQFEAWRQPKTGEIAIWDPARERHVMMPKGFNHVALSAALTNLGYYHEEAAALAATR